MRTSTSTRAGRATRSMKLTQILRTVRAGAEKDSADALGWPTGLPQTSGMDRRGKHGHLLAIGLLVALTCACAAGDPRFAGETPAGFWAGLWHGIIAPITFIIGLFADGVEIYERNNTGGWYDFGFLLGVGCLSGGGGTKMRRKRKVEFDAAEWHKISEGLETKIRTQIREWADAEPDEDWRLVEDKARAKLKRKIREWADED